MTIHPFQPDDLPHLREIMIEAFDGVSIDKAIEEQVGIVNGHNWQWRKARHLDEDVARAPDGVFVATDKSGAIIGFITSWRDDAAGIGFIPNLCVAAGHRGQGIGRDLIRHVLDDFRRHGLTHARIETLAHNDAGYGLYTSLGFEEVVRQVHFVKSLGPSEEESAK